ncbi:MAG TPA: hypothetical protein VN922_19535 [Bacteroidia bacterium]|nr:hypothetical protein [Bacteroidia bacterium]
MKKTILILIAFYWYNAIALTYIITNSSFNQTDSVCLSSNQSIDVKTTGNYTSSDHLKIYISHIDAVGNSSNLSLLLDSIFWTYYPSLPTNADGSKTIYFHMPASYLFGRFSICIDLGPSLAYGLLYNGCLNYIQIYHAAPTIIGMYDMNGMPTTISNGLIIVFYSDGSRKKLYYITTQ